MKMESTVSGISFANKDKLFETLRPEGKLQLIHKDDNKYDPKAIEIHYLGTKVGFVGMGTFMQDTLRSHPEITEVDICGYSYATGKGNDLAFNDDHKGRLSSIKFSVEIEDAKIGPVLNDKNQYVIGDGEYDRVTSVLSYANLEPNNDGLLRWQIKHDSYEDYRKELNDSATKGTAMHDAIECWIGGDDSKMDLIPEGFFTWWNKFNPVVTDVEVLVRDDKLMVAGRYDLRCTIDGVDSIVDWKSSKKVNSKHRVQVGIYCKMSGAQQGIVLALGAKTKQGYSASKVEGDKIDKAYQVLTCAKGIKEVMG